MLSIFRAVHHAFKRQREAIIEAKVGKQSFLLFAIYNIKQQQHYIHLSASLLGLRTSIICLPSLLSLLSFTPRSLRSRFHSWVMFSPLGNVMAFYCNVSPEMQPLLIVPGFKQASLLKASAQGTTGAPWASKEKG